MSVTKKDWGYYNGYKVYLFSIKNKDIQVNVTNFGAAVVNIFTPDRNGKIDDIILGYDNLEGYARGKSYQGATIGRYANRIAGAKFTLDWRTFDLSRNEGANCLHGGLYGYNTRVWELESVEENSIIMSYKSPDGECGFPGNVNIEVKFSVSDDNGLYIYYKAATDADTVVNLTNHCYFNLGGFNSGDILDTELQLFSDSYTPVNENLIPTGEIKSVKGTALDFTSPKPLGQDIRSGLIKGYDHNFIFGNTKLAFAYDDKTGRSLEVYTNKPAIQLYTGNALSETGKLGSVVKPFGGFCLETQFSPDTPNQEGFSSCVLRKGELYSYFTRYQFGRLEALKK